MIIKHCFCLIVILNIAHVVVHAAEAQQTDVSYTGVSSRYVKITDGFWAARLETNRRVTIPHLLRMNEENDRLNNLRKGAGLMEGSYQSRRYNDTDVYKLLEAIGFSLMMHPDPELERIADAASI